MLRRTGAIAIALLVAPFPQGARAAGTATLLEKVGGSLVDSATGELISAGLANAGIFEAIGLGSKADREMQAKLQEILNKLEVLQASVDGIDRDLQAFGNEILKTEYSGQLQTPLTQMGIAQGAIRNCLDQLANVQLEEAGTPQGDLDLQSYAAQIIGKASGVCDLKHQFGTIHYEMVGDPALVVAGIQHTVYTLLSKVACDQSVPFDVVASHFVSYHLQQRAIVELIRQAYAARGENLALADTLLGPGGLLAQLRDEEVALLEAADAYVLCQAPPSGYDPGPWMLADAIVQRLEGVQRQITTASISWVPVAGPLSPTIVSPDGQTVVSLTGQLEGATRSYYGSFPDQTAGTRLWFRTCQAGGSEEYAYTAPDPSKPLGYMIDSGCTVGLARHTMRDLPAAVLDPSSVVKMRAPPDGMPDYTLGAPTVLNGATLTAESSLDALALEASADGRASGASAFQLVPSGADPSVVNLLIDLPLSGLTGVALRVDTSGRHAFVAGGAGRVAAFQRVPAGPAQPDGFALREVESGQYLQPGASGDAVLGSSSFTFDLVRPPVGGTELAYDDATLGRGVLYVNQQYEQYQVIEVHGGNYVNQGGVANPDTDASHWWVENVPWIQHPFFTMGDVSGYWPQGCVTGSNSLGGSSALGDPTKADSECSNEGFPYVRLATSFTNPEESPRGFQLTLGTTAIHAKGYPPTTAQGGAWFHCWINDATPSAVMTFDSPSAPDGQNVMASTPVSVTLPPRSTYTLVCQWGDHISYPSIPDLAQVIVTPCRLGTGTSGGAPCQNFF